ncbi:MAG: hypothetical protein ACD_27C00053G0001 [uncultured bacterium]|nr:MAG: hypothetical protein ACD_27C00053G0001 [uncultured bacterium]
MVKFSGREMAHKEFGQKLLDTVLTRLSDVSTVVEAPKLIGKFLIAQIKPKK